MISRTVFIMGLVLAFAGFLGLQYTAAPFFLVFAAAFIAVAGTEIVITWWKQLKAPTSDSPIECPHCGAESFLADYNGTKKVRCTSPYCAATGGSSPYDQIAIKLWNTRYRE